MIPAPSRTDMLKVLHEFWGDPKVGDAIWGLSDGYGEPGFVPVQGYDWSGIRDSSDDAIKAMYEVVLRQYPDAATNR